MLDDDAATTPKPNSSVLTKAEEARQKRRRERRLEMNRLTARNRRRRQRDLLEDLAKTAESLREENAALSEENEEMRKRIMASIGVGVVAPSPSVRAAADRPEAAFERAVRESRAQQQQKKAPSLPAFTIASTDQASPALRATLTPSTAATANAISAWNEIEEVLAKYSAERRDGILRAAALLGQKPQVQQQQSRNNPTAANLSTAMPPLVNAEEQGVLRATTTFQGGRNVASGNAPLPPKLSLGTTRSGSELKASVPNVDVDDLLHRALQHYQKDKEVFTAGDSSLTNKRHSHKSTMPDQPQPQPQRTLSKPSGSTSASTYFAQEAA